jgi:hypothetical protein
MKVMYEDVIHKRNRNITRVLLYYADEWKEMYEEVKEARARARKLTPPKAPPPPLLVKFVMPDGQVRGKKDAACIIDLRKGELRVPSYGVVQRGGGAS